jgi:acyl dehydratase
MLITDVVRINQLTATLNYGLNKVRFPAPVPVGSRLRGAVTLRGAQRRPTGVEAVFDLFRELDGATRPACVAEVVLLYR